MADTLYPLGRPSAGQLDRTDLLFHDLRSEIRRGRDPLEPPPEFDVDPDLIPEHLWLKAQAAEIVRQAESLAVLTSSQDLAFNARLQHVQEVSTAAVTADVLRIRILEAAHKRGRDSDLNSAVMDHQKWWSTRYLPPEEIRFRSAHLGIDTEKLTLDEQLEAMEREAIEARREADRLRASEGALDVVELANVLQRERRSREAVSLLGPRDPGSIGQFLTQAVFPVIEVLDRPFNAVRGFLVGEDPMDSIRNSWLGISGQEHYLGRDIGFVRLLPDNDFLPFSLSARDVAGGAAELALDLAVVGKAAKVVRTVRRTVPQGVAPPTYVAPARHITDYADEVVTSDSPLVRAIVGRSGINPAVLENTPVGRIAVGYKVHQIADENLAEIAVSAAYDPWSVRFAGIAPVGRGRVGHLSARWRRPSDPRCGRSPPSPSTPRSRCARRSTARHASPCVARATRYRRPAPAGRWRCAWAVRR